MSEQIKVGPSSCCVCGGEYGKHQNWCSQSKPKVSDKINDGGPAFPAMSLRDYFAGQAIAGIMVGCSSYIGFGDNCEFTVYGGGPCNKGAADRAYAIADAMLAARKEAPRE